ncbi:acyl-CoA dehydrogenase [Amphritea sp. 2_MG-2023]|uniref:acyl-CoA dehydrogenase family protein n=1 Tax=Amphritea TaxID=515417 RepID=UPI001C072790|nr:MULTISPECIES: acyl-CoA dehydrogenase [Amphritea]MBU2964068.1 acyl-CoA dehydrogenase [Amphritea atlantica]MDO6418466.1 acyl-CoA dehydrogenase [Amphritea sp. 2_MG-2023]
MDFSLNDIQQMMQDSAAKFIQNDYDFETRRGLSNSPAGYSEDNWKLFAELGWLALPIKEAYGGLDGDLVDTMVLQQEFGKGLLVEPYYATVLLGANLIQKQASDAQKLELLEPVVAGELKLALAHSEAQASFDVSQTKTRAEKQGDQYVLNGHKAVVLGAESADYLLVPARTSGVVGDAEGISLFLIDPKSAGVQLRGYATNDGLRAADIGLTEVTVPASSILGQADSAAPAIELVLNEAIVALGAEAVGIMEKLLAATSEYIKTRQQFDQPISRFQVLQHRLADMFMETEQAKSMVYFAAMEVAKGGSEASRVASMLKVKIGSAGRLVGQQAVQLHGGMGITDELDVGHFFKRLTCINNQLGTRDYHLQSLINKAAAG